MERPNDVFMAGGDPFAAVPHRLIRELRNAKAIALYAVLAMFADWQTGLAHPSVKTVYSMMGYRSRKAYDEGLALLVREGWVETFPRWQVEDGGTPTVVYQKPKGDHGWRQTSNGYVVYRSPGGEGVVPSREGGYSPLGKGGSAPEGRGVVPYREHEQEPYKPQPVEQEPVIKVEGASAPAPKRKKARATTLPEGWMPDQPVIDQMRAEHPGVNLEAEHRKFTDYFNSVAGERGRKRDWNATWRNWIRRAGERAPVAQEDALDVARRMAAREQAEPTIFDSGQKGIGF